MDDLKKEAWEPYELDPPLVFSNESVEKKKINAGTGSLSEQMVNSEIQS
jgi:hypothetical protein